MSILNSLTEAECNTLDCVLQRIPHVRDTIQAFAECGEDCEERKKLLDMIEERAKQLKAKFNPLAE